MGLRVTEMIANQDEFESAPKDDVTIHIPIKPVNHTQVRVFGRWRSFEVHRGLVAVTPAAHTWRLRYNSGHDHNTSRHLHLYIPVSTFESAAEQTLSRTAPGNLLDAAFFVDRPITYLSFLLLQSLKDGVSNFYAQASAQWLTAHLLSKGHQISGWLERMSKASVTDPLLLRVLEYIEEHIGTDLSLEVLAREAGVSQFQFATVFQRQMGMSPNKHVHRLRMQNASRMLCESNRSVTEVALLCGFRTASHFGVAFQKHFGKRPLEYRFAQKGSRLRPLESVDLPRSDFTHA